MEAIAIFLLLGLLGIVLLVIPGPTVRVNDPKPLASYKQVDLEAQQRWEEEFRRLVPPPPIQQFTYQAWLSRTLDETKKMVQAVHVRYAPGSDNFRISATRDDEYPITCPACGNRFRLSEFERHKLLVHGLFPAAGESVRTEDILNGDYWRTSTLDPWGR